MLETFCKHFFIPKSSRAIIIELNRPSLLYFIKPFFSTNFSLKHFSHTQGLPVKFTTSYLFKIPVYHQMKFPFSNHIRARKVTSKLNPANVKKYVRREIQRCGLESIKDATKKWRDVSI